VLPLILMALASAPTCQVENARYQLRTAPSVTADFRSVDSGPDWPAHLAMRLHVGASGRDYWFLPWNGGTDGRAHMASTTDVTSPAWKAPSPDSASQRPLGDFDYVGTDASYLVIEGTPEQGDAAPGHMLISNLNDALWHQTSSDRRDAVPTQFFDLVACGKP
jgi:hypothetical protein